MSGSILNMWEVLANLMTAHRKAYHLLHEVDTVDADKDGVSVSVGLAKNYNIFRPDNHWNIVDPLLTGAAHMFVNSIYLAGADVPNSVDWFGVNHYFTMKVHFPTYDYVGTHNSLGEALYELNRRYGDVPFTSPSMARMTGIYTTRKDPNI